MGNDDLVYSNTALLARADMYARTSSEQLFYVEDQGKEYFYEAIFERLFDEFKIEFRPLGLGGKDKVIDRYKENQEKGINDCFYLVDGDFDRFIGKYMIDDISFIYLNSYNIENNIIDKDVVIKFLRGKLSLEKSGIESLFDFDDWKKQIVAQSKKLFLCYAFIQKFALEKKVPALPNVSRSPFEFLDNKTGYEKSGLFDEYYQKVLEFVHQKDAGNATEIYRQSVGEISILFERLHGPEYFYFICGKFLINSLESRIGAVLKSQGCSHQFDRKDFRNQLVSYFDISCLGYIKERVQRALSS